MSSEWQSVRLGDCCFKIGSGATPKGGKESYLDSGAFRLIRSQNVYNDGFHPSGLAFIGEDQARKLEGVSVEASDILLNITGDSVARVCLAPPQYLPASVNQHVAIIRPDPKVLDSRFLRYFLVSPQQQDFLLGLAAAGATRNALTKGMIEDLCVPCPDIAIQKIIADSLSSLDDRITLLRETNATLEAIAQALFKSWFVDFDPVHAKQEGRIPEGMDEATAALFPDSFEESELGLVPNGWHYASLSDAYEINPKRGLKKGVIAPYLDMASAPSAGHCAETFIFREMGSGSKYIHGDTLLARITPCLENGKTAFVDFLDDQQVGWGSTEFLVLRPNPPLPEYHAYLLCRLDKFREFAVQSMSGTSGRQRIQKDVLGRFQVSIPSKPVAVEFGHTVTAIQERITANHAVSQTLSSLRDTLLPRLISGKLRLPEAAAEVEAIAS